MAVLNRNLLNQLKTPRGAVVLVLAVVFIAVWGRTLTRASHRAPKGVQAAAVVVSRQENFLVRQRLGENLEGNFSWGSDPFYREIISTRSVSRGPRPQTPLIEPPPPRFLNLTGVSVRGMNSVCVINGEIFRVGEIVGGYTISSIQKETVVLEKDGQVRTLKMGGE